MTPVTNTVQQKCLQVLSAFPKGSAYSGSVGLEGDSIVSDQPNDQGYTEITILDLSTQHITSLTEKKPTSFAASPSGEKYAVIYKTSPAVNIYSSDGRLLNRIFPKTEGWYLDQWLDDTKLVVGVIDNHYPINVAIIDVMTNKSTQMTSRKYPEIEKTRNRFVWEGGDTTKYDPALTRVLYRGDKGTYIWDLEQQKVMATIAEGDPGAPPKWSPD